MIDFAKITKTLDGYACHYFGTRESYGVTLHCFAVFHPKYGAHEVDYDANGKRLRYDTGKWVLSTATDCQIIAPPKIVEVAQYIALYEKAHAPGEYYIIGAKDENEFSNTQFFRGLQQHTFRFEVPNE